MLWGIMTFSPLNILCHWTLIVGHDSSSKVGILLVYLALSLATLWQSLMRVVAVVGPF